MKPLVLPGAEEWATGAFRGGPPLRLDVPRAGPQQVTGRRPARHRRHRARRLAHVRKVLPDDPAALDKADAAALPRSQPGDVQVCFRPAGFGSRCVAGGGAGMRVDLAYFRAQ
ncbi:MAG: hypothetical protein IPK64_02900 [bacterium]|nr:hypothetical protein [bacterium]